MNSLSNRSNTPLHKYQKNWFPLRCVNIIGQCWKNLSESCFSSRQDYYDLIYIFDYLLIELHLISSDCVYVCVCECRNKVRKCVSVCSYQCVCKCPAVYFCETAIAICTPSHVTQPCCRFYGSSICSEVTRLTGKKRLRERRLNKDREKRGEPEDWPKEMKTQHNVETDKEESSSRSEV